MTQLRALCLIVALIALAQIALSPRAIAEPLDPLIAKHATANGVPESLVRRVIRIESRGNPRVVNKGNYGLMQIRLGTARGLGYRGTAQGLLDPDINMAYAVKYLAAAYRLAGCNDNRAVLYYQRGYYGAAKFKCGTIQPRLAQDDRAASARRQAQQQTSR